MEVTAQTTEKLGHYLSQLVTFSDPALLVRTEPSPEGLVLMVVQEFPVAGVRLLLARDFLLSNQDARVLQVIRDWVKHWLSRGLPAMQEEQYVAQTITVQSHGIS